MKTDDIYKSSRHQKIIGDFGEHLICNWLSRSGVEVTRVDHTGVDIIAYDSETGKRIGIAVTSRTRNVGKEKESVNFLHKKDRKKLDDACEAFGCEPWIGVYVETSHFADLYLTSLRNYEEKYRGKIRTIDAWKMGSEYERRYSRDPEVKHVRFQFDTVGWDWKPKSG
jgi:Holliday junction resolvase-like predicted endonuclease